MRLSIGQNQGQPLIRLSEVQIRELGVDIGSEVEATIENGALVIKPVQTETLTHEELMQKIREKFS